MKWYQTMEFIQALHTGRGHWTVTVGEQLAHRTQGVIAGLDFDSIGVSLTTLLSSCIVAG